MNDVNDFLKCPKCHRTSTVRLVIHLDGDVTLKCDACDAMAIANPSHESERVYE